MQTMTAPPVDDAIRAYVAELAGEDIPLTAELSVASVLADLCRWGGVPVPAAVAEAVAAVESTVAWPTATPGRPVPLVADLAALRRVLVAMRDSEHQEPFAFGLTNWASIYTHQLAGARGLTVAEHLARPVPLGAALAGLFLTAGVAPPAAVSDWLAGVPAPAT